MTERTRSRTRRPIALLLLLFVGLAAIASGVAYLLVGSGGEEAATVVTRPQVQIVSPASGAEILTASPVSVRAIAIHAAKIERIELWIDGELVQAQTSALEGGTSPFPLVVYWQPEAPGPHRLTARAFNTGDVRAETSIEVTAIDAVASSGDDDGDGVGNLDDDCPDVGGSPLALGCPDRDGDGLGDDEDVCADEAGLVSQDGCPLPDDADSDGISDEIDECPDAAGVLVTEGCPDSDADAIPDGADACPEDIGSEGALPGDGCPATSATDRDGDGVADAEDACADEAGPAGTEGCPDGEGDGVRDVEDVCPDEAGLAGDDGCPVPGGAEDRDGDGVRDVEDACPDEPGALDRDGCPAEEVPEVEPADHVANDADGDGVADEADLCPEEAGLPEHEGCPEPGAGADADGDGIPDPEGGPADDSSPSFPDMDASSILMPVEFQALSFEVSDDLDGVYCYPRLTGAHVERYALEPLDGRQWDIAADLGSRTLGLFPSEDLQVDIECGGDNLFLGPEGGWGTYYNLGSTSRTHPESDWDGHVITVRSAGGDDGHWFEAQYRMCIGGCEDAAFTPPTINLLLASVIGRGDWLLIDWSGDRQAIDGFHLYADGRRLITIPADATSQSMAGYEPLCGSGAREFYVTAYQGDRESPPSNPAYWNRKPCPRVIRVTFDEFKTTSLVIEGPPFGTFWAGGATEESLNFDGGGTRAFEGAHLIANYVYDIQDYFDLVNSLGAQAELSGGLESRYRAPNTNTVTVQLGPNDDLTIGGVIYIRQRQGYEEMFRAWQDIPSADLVPGQYTIRDGGAELTVTIDVIVGPEAGDRPDLTITDVTEFGGQLRIHLFNSAAPLENTDVDVRLVRISTNEQLGVYTWENVSIPSGGTRILQSASLNMEPYDLRVIVDPENRILETDAGNNLFETPVVMRVEFTGLQVPGWPCESFLAQYGEVWFQVGVGYGREENQIQWIADRVRYPQMGIIRWDRWGYPPPIYDLNGNTRFSFEFEMPAGDNLYIHLLGFEQDGSTNQSMGVIQASYPPFENYGATDREYSDRSSGLGATNCNEVEPTVDYFGFYGWWRITRIH